jgi:hypothetical protein
VVFFGSGSFVCFGGYFNLAYGFEEVLADCSHGELGEYQSFVARLESGQRRIDVVELIWISNALGFDPKHVIKALMEIDK